MGILLQWKFHRLRKRLLQKGIPVTGKVEEILDKFVYPLALAQKNGLPKDLRPAIRISYRTPAGKEQTLQLRTEDKSPFEPVGREIPLRYLCENGRDIAVPEVVLRQNAKQ